MLAMKFKLQEPIKDQITPKYKKTICGVRNPDYVTTKGGNIGHQHLVTAPKGVKITLAFFFRCLVRAWFLLLRPSEWSQVSVVHTNCDFFDCDFTVFQIENAKFDETACGWVGEMTCNCGELGERYNIYRSSTNVPICPVCTFHDPDIEKGWEQVKAFPTAVLSKMMGGVLVSCLDETAFCGVWQQTHLMHLCRVGGAMAMADSSCPLPEISTHGRWSSLSTAWGYEKQARSSAGLVCLNKWPIRKAFPLGKIGDFEATWKLRGKSLLTRKCNSKKHLLQLKAARVKLEKFDKKETLPPKSSP